MIRFLFILISFVTFGGQAQADVRCIQAYLAETAFDPGPYILKRERTGLMGGAATYRSYALPNLSSAGSSSRTGHVVFGALAVGCWLLAMFNFKNR